MRLTDLHPISPAGRHMLFGYPVSNPAELGARGVPEDGGLWIMDVESGSSRLLCSFARMAALHPEPHDLEDAFCFADHPAFNCDGTRLYVLFRYMLPPKPDGWRDWKTYLYTVGADGDGSGWRSWSEIMQFRGRLGTLADSGGMA